jgi:hypothetical protein
MRASEREAKAMNSPEQEGSGIRGIAPGIRASTLLRAHLVACPDRLDGDLDVLDRDGGRPAARNPGPTRK